MANTISNKTQRLYGEGTDPRMWRYMDYNNVLKLKIELASKRITKLFEVDKMQRDNNNISECEKSIKLCREMIKEIEM